MVRTGLKEILNAVLVIHRWARISQQPDYTTSMLEFINATHRQRNNILAKEYMTQVADKYEKLAESDRDARKHMKNAEKWIREFDKLIVEQQKRDAKNQAS